MVNPERLRNILSAVYKCHEGNRLCRKEVESIYNDLSCAVTELHDIEGFLQFEADHNDRKILVFDEETMHYLGLIPYVDNEFMNCFGELYTVYLVKGNTAYTQCAVVYKDLYHDELYEAEIGIDLEVAPIIPLGVYDPRTDKFYRWRDK